jgi:hypothetical protein
VLVHGSKRSRAYSAGSVQAPFGKNFSRFLAIKL